MPQIAVFSDVHANLPALTAVLSDITRRGIDQCYCLGDLVDFAPWGNEVIDLLRRTHIPCLLGNHDERVAFDYSVQPLPTHDALETSNRLQAIADSKQRITADNKRWLAQLPYQLEITFNIGGHLKRIWLVHASPTRNDQYIYESHPEADLRHQLGARPVDVLLMGHTHLSYIKRGQPLLVNCGSVGRSKEADRLASYCVLTLSEEVIEAEIIKLSYPVAAVAEAIYQSAIPDFYADFLLQKQSEALASSHEGS